MYKRIFTSLTIAFAMAGAAFTGTATARQVQDSGAWAVPASTQTGVVSKPLAGQSQQAIIREKLGEIGAWAVPSNSTQTPSNSTQTEIVPKSQQAIIREKLGEIGAWAVPSNSTQTEIVPKSLPTSPTTVVASSSDRFDWNDAGIGGAFVFSAVLLGAASLVTIRRHQQHGPVAH
jgi:hypothetical protein